MGELAKSWTRGLQSPRPSLLNASRTLLQAVVTLKHFAVNSLENTSPWTRTTFDANASFGLSPFALADYYFKAFRAAIKDADARGVMCAYNAVLGTPACLSPLLRSARASWGFRGYVTSDTDSIASATSDHHFTRTAQQATALGLTRGQCDLNSGSTYQDNVLAAVAAKEEGLTTVVPPCPTRSTGPRSRTRPPCLHHEHRLALHRDALRDQPCIRFRLRGTAAAVWFALVEDCNPEAEW